MRTINLFANPNEFFEERIKYPTMTAQSAIILVTALAFGGQMIGVYFTTLGMEVNHYESLIIVLSIVQMIVPLVLWPAFTLIFWGIGKAVNAQLRFKLLLRLTGWGFLPMIGAGMSLALGRYVPLRAANPCNAALVCDPAYTGTLTLLVEDLFLYIGSATSSVVFQAAFVVAVLFILLSAYLWYNAVYEASTLTRQGAFLAVAPQYWSALWCTPT
ncbi:YIP1 family protein [Halocatena marina]|uniref:YIP1 family protein n=1 Tax=Halocatena marina TaxID=2934937 RepID=A0ABD5YXC5_9EURY